MKAKNIFFCFLIYLLILTGITQAQWAQTNGPYGGTINCLAVSGTNLFAGTYGGGVFYLPTTAQAGLRSITA